MMKSDLSQNRNGCFSKEHYRLLFDKAQSGILVLDPSNGKVIDINPYCLKMMGYTKKEILNKFIWKLDFAKDIVANKEQFLTLCQRNNKLYEYFSFQTTSGKTLQVELIVKCYKEGNKKVILCSIFNVEIRTEIDKTKHKISTMYHVIMLCNQILLHEMNITTMFKQMCVAITSVGGYHSAWIGHAPESSSDLIKPIASENISNSYFEMLNFRGNNKKTTTSLVANALFSNKIVMINDLVLASNNTKEVTYAKKCGYSSVAMIPIKVNVDKFYVLVIYGFKSYALPKEIVTLLQNLAVDICLAIEHIEARKLHLTIKNQMESSLNNTIAAIAAMVEQRDPYTAGHQSRVAKLAVAIASEMGLAPEKIMGLKMASVVHDIGKIHIPAEILAKPSQLTDSEYEIIKTHPKSGWEVLNKIDFPWPIAEIVYQHHERLNGSGYPRGLKGTEILLEAKILMVADTIDAMSAHRPYRPSLGILSSLQEIMKNKGKLYDATVVDACIKLFIEKRYEIK